MDGVTKLMLFKLAASLLLPPRPPHDALAQSIWFTETAIKIRVVIFLGTLIGCSALAKDLMRIVKLSAAFWSVTLGRVG